MRAPPRVPNNGPLRVTLDLAIASPDIGRSHLHVASRVTCRVQWPTSLSPNHTWKRELAPHYVCTVRRIHACLVGLSINNSAIGLAGFHHRIIQLIPRGRDWQCPLFALSYSFAGRSRLVPPPHLSIPQSWSHSITHWRCPIPPPRTLHSPAAADLGSFAQPAFKSGCCTPATSRFLFSLLPLIWPVVATFYLCVPSTLISFSFFV